MDRALKGVEGGDTAQIILYYKKCMFNKGEKLKDKIEYPSILIFQLIILEKSLFF